MVDIRTPRITPSARAAGRVSSAGSQATKNLANAAAGAADTFTEFYEKEAAIQGDLLLAEVQEEWNRTYNDRAKQAGAGFAKSILGDFDKFRQEKIAAYQAEAAERGQANVPKRAEQEVNAALDKYRMRLETKSIAREAAARAAAKRAAASKARRLKLNALISDPSMLPEYLEGAKTAGERNDYITTAMGMVVRDDPQRVLDEVMSGKWDADISPSQKKSFIKLADSGIARIERENEAIAKNMQNAFEGELEEELAFAQANGALPVDSSFDEERIDDLYSMNPERGAEVKARFKEGVEFAETMHTVSTATPEQLEMEAIKLQEKVATPGNTKTDVKRQQQFVSAVQERNTAIQNDAASYVGGNVDVVGEMFGIVESAPPETQALAARNYARNLEFQYDRLGVPDEFRNVLPNDAAANTVAQFNEMGSDVAAQALSDYVNTWGDAAPRVIEQLDKAGLAKEYTVAMRHTDNPGLSQALVNLAAVDTTELTQGLPTAMVTDTRNELAETMVEYRQAFEFAGGGGAQETMNKHYEVSEKFALDLVRRGVDPSDAVERATTQMFPETVVQENNGQYILPVGLDESAVRNGADELMDREVLTGAIAAVNDPRFPDFADMDVTLSSASRAGIWVNNSTGDGLQLMLSLNGYLLPVQTPEGEPYGFTFSELTAAGSGTNTVIDQNFDLPGPFGRSQ
jgi:hypothetical protein